LTDPLEGRLRNVPIPDDEEDDGEPQRKRKRTSGPGPLTPTPSTGAKGKGSQTIVIDDDDNEQDDEQPSRAPAAGGPLLHQPASGPDTTRRQLLPSGRTASGNDTRFLPGPGFVDLTDNPYHYQPREAAAPEPVGGRSHIRTVVREETEQRMRDVTDLVGADIQRVVRAEVANNIGALVRDEVAGSLRAMVRDEVARQLPAVVRDEVARQLSSVLRAPAMGRSDSQTQSPAYYPQQQFNPIPVGRGGPPSRRQPLTGRSGSNPEAGAEAAATSRTPLPTARSGQFPTSDVRSRVRGRQGDKIVEDEEKKYKKEDHRA